MKPLLGGITVKKVAFVFLELILLICLAFGIIRTLDLLSEPEVMWNAVFVGIAWCFLSLFFFLKTRKKRKSAKKKKTIQHSKHKESTANNNSCVTAGTQFAEFSTATPITQNTNKSDEYRSTSISIQKNMPAKPSSNNTVQMKASAPTPKKRLIHPEELDFDEVIQRYLTTNHSTVSSVYDYYSYFRAEFDCLLRNIPRMPVELHDKKVLRGKEILTPFEKTAPITKHTTKAEVANFVVIDTETTGIRTGGNDIIELTAIKFENFIPVSMFSTLLKPRKPIPEDATRINGITDEMVQFAPAFAQIKSSLEAFVGNYPIVAHNAEFDVKFLHVSGMEFQQDTVFYDTLELSRLHIRETDGTKLASYKLANVCDECCIYFDGAHRSSADALATGLLFIEIVKAVFESENIYSICFPTNPIVSIDDLDDWDYYQTRKPVKTFTVTDRSEDAFAGYYSVGDEVEQGYDWEKDKDTLEIGYGPLCNTPKSVQTFFEENSGSYRLFVLDAYEDDNGRVKVKIGIYVEK